MTSEETRRLTEFLQPSRIAVVATIGPSGMPQLTPNWYCCADGKLMISTTKERVKYRHLARNGRMNDLQLLRAAGTRLRDLVGTRDHS